MTLILWGSQSRLRYWSGTPKIQQTWSHCNSDAHTPLVLTLGGLQMSHLFTEQENSDNKWLLSVECPACFFKMWLKIGTAMKLGDAPIFSKRRQDWKNCHSKWQWKKKSCDLQKIRGEEPKKRTFKWERSFKKLLWKILWNLTTILGFCVAHGHPS